MRGQDQLIMSAERAPALGILTGWVDSGLVHGDQNIKLNYITAI
jgi:hypothetical protein